MHRDNASNAFAAGLIARAEELAPVLDARAGEANAIGRIPADTLADLQAAGFFKVLQPKRYGGSELDPQTFFDIQMALARGCMSTAWVYGVVGVHNWQLALFDERAPRRRVREIASAIAGDVDRRADVGDVEWARAIQAPAQPSDRQ